MSTPRKPHEPLRMFEHQTLKVGEQGFTAHHLKRLERFHDSFRRANDDKRCPYFELAHNGVRFSQHVGVLQMGDLQIEVLPKADKAHDENFWQARLFDMLRVSGDIPVRESHSSSLRIRHNSVLEFYFALFVNELTSLMRRGLIKRYRQIEGNRFALKGQLMFAQHVRQNLVHRERFYVRHTTYDTQHQHHQLLYKALRLIQRLNRNPLLDSAIGGLLLDFPEQGDLSVTAATFERLPTGRKTAPYTTAMQIARLILLNFHPDVQQGREDILALMFDMNRLWESFVLVSLQQQLGKGYRVVRTPRKLFWKSRTEAKKLQKWIEPDILLQSRIDKSALLLDTKWKMPDDNKPGNADLFQLYAYHHFFQAKKVALVYPSASNDGAIVSGFYADGTGTKSCDIIRLPVGESLRLAASDWRASEGLGASRPRLTRISP